MYHYFKSLGGVKYRGWGWSHCHKPTHFCRLPSHMRPLPNSVNTLPGMTWFGHNEVEKTSTRFSFHSSSPENPVPGFICVWTKTRRNIGRRYELFINEETTGPECWLSHRWITCLFWKNELEEKFITARLCAREPAHTPLAPYVRS